MHSRQPAPVGTILLVDLDRESALPLSEQIYASIRGAIDLGRLQPQTVLPSSRALASDLKVARSTVTLAFELLRKEGYIEGSHGRVNRVTSRLPQPPRVARPRSAAPGQPPRISRRGLQVPALPDDVARLLSKKPRAFRAGIPALDLFPVDVWHRLLSRAWRRTSPQSLSYGDPMGYAPLRRAVADYLRSARGLHCTEDQVIICGGSQQALDLCVRLMLDPGDRAWIEDPGYLGARVAIEAAGGTVVPVPVDAEGIDVTAGIRLAPDARLAFVTPARQVPLGMAMSESRRRALLTWAAQAGAWIFEDDFDSELRYASAPLVPLQAQDAADSVVLAGTFSKVMLPALRLGYLVVPPALIDPLRRLRMAADFGSPTLMQAVLTDFIAEGHFARHIRRMRAVYQERHDLIVDLLQTKLHGVVEPEVVGAGLTMMAWLPEWMDDAAVAARAPQFDLELLALGTITLQHRRRPGLLLGFGGLSDSDIRDGVERLARLLASFAR